MTIDELLKKHASQGMAPGVLQGLLASLPQGQMPQGQMPQGQMPPGQMPQGQMPPGQMPQGQMPQGQMPQGQMPPGGLNNDQIRALYGGLAPHTDDPLGLLNSYTSVMHRQQGIDNQNDPRETLMRVYGNVNPFDYDASSIQDFHTQLMQGNVRFDLLKERQKTTATSTKIVDDAITGAFAAEESLARMATLSGRFHDVALKGVRGGIIGKGHEWWKNVVGSEDNMTQLRQEYEQLRVSKVVDSLPAGPASDKDIEIVMKGWPASTAGPAYLASFLRGMMKMQALKHAQATHGAMYVSQNPNQKGRLEDWAKRKNALYRQALEPYGGFYAPRKDDGSSYSAEEAAELFYSRVTPGTPAQQSMGQSQIDPAQIDDVPLDALLQRLESEPD